MGYYTRFTGQININPPLTWLQFKDSEYLEDGRGWVDRDLKFVVEGETKHTSEGPLVVNRAVGLVSRSEDEMKGYYIVEQLQQLVDLYPEHEFTGYLECEGEESGDLWRLQVKNRKAVRVEPTITWPED